MLSTEDFHSNKYRTEDSINLNHAYIPEISYIQLLMISNEDGFHQINQFYLR